MGTSTNYPGRSDLLFSLKENMDNCAKSWRVCRKNALKPPSNPVLLDVRPAVAHTLAGDPACLSIFLKP